VKQRGSVNLSGITSCQEPHQVPEPDGAPPRGVVHVGEQVEPVPDVGQVAAFRDRRLLLWLFSNFAII
jgi:hypothetical protein